MPYPLPTEGPPYSSDLRWFLVAVPDDPAFVQAALGAYTEFTHYWKWGKEGKEPGRNEAAQAWEDAVGATLEALEMGFPDTLLGYIDTVEAKLQLLIDKDCCGDRLVDDIYGDNPTVTLEEDMTGSDIEVGTGTPPGGYADWPAYSSYLCDAATAFAQSLPGYLANFEAVFTGLATITSAGLLLLIAAFLPGIGLPIAVVGALLLLADLLDLQSTVADLIVSQEDWDAAMQGLEDAELDIICAVIGSTTAAEASSAVRSAIEAHSQYAADALFAILPIVPGLLRRIFNAEADIVAGFGGGCANCGEQTDSWEYYFATEDEGWERYDNADPKNNEGQTYSSAGCPTAGSLGIPPTGRWAISPVLVAVAHNRVSVAFNRKSGNGTVPGAVHILDADDLSSLGNSSFTAVTTCAAINPVPVFTHSASTFRIGFYQPPGSGQNLYIDNVVITVSTV